jgi:hypothetical protein
VYPPGASEGRVIWRGRIEEVLVATPGGDRVLFSKETPAGKFELWSIALDGSGLAAASGADVAPTKGLHVAKNGGPAIWSTCETSSEIGALGREAGQLRPKALFPPAPWRDVQPVSVPGSDRVVVLSDRAARRQPWIVDRTNKTPPRAVRGDLVDLQSCAVTPDGKQMVAALANGGLRLVAIDGAEPPTVLTRGRVDGAPSVARTGNVVFSTVTDAGAPRIASIPLGGGTPRVLVDAASTAPSVSPDGNIVIYLALERQDEGRPRVLDVATSASRPLAPSLPVGRWAPAAFSPDGKRVVMSPGPSALIEIDVASGEIVGRFDTGGDEIAGYTYLGEDIVFARQVWSGDLWMGDAPFPARAEAGSRFGRW